MQAASQGIGGGFAIAGAGNGGCVWAICPEPEQTGKLRLRWQELIKDFPYGEVLDVGIDETGLAIEATESRSGQSVAPPKRKPSAEASRTFPAKPML